MGPIELGALAILTATHGAVAYGGFMFANALARADAAEEALEAQNLAIKEAERRHAEYEEADNAIDNADIGDLSRMLHDSASEATGETQVSA